MSGPYSMWCSRSRWGLHDTLNQKLRLLCAVETLPWICLVCLHLFPLSPVCWVPFLVLVSIFGTFNIKIHVLIKIFMLGLNFWFRVARTKIIHRCSLVNALMQLCYLGITKSNITTIIASGKWHVMSITRQKKIRNNKRKLVSTKCACPASDFPWMFYPVAI